MRELVDLVPFVQAPEWGAWEPLALTMILAAGVSAVAAGMAALRRANPALVHVLALTSLCSVTSGLMGVFVPLEQPLRVWEFAVHPSFSSWTAWGAYILPLCFLSLLVLLRQSCTRRGPGKLVGAAAVCLGILALAYATGEVRACVGRVLWTEYWSQLFLLAAGFVAACGLTLLAVLRLSFESFARGGEHAVPLLELGATCLGCTLLCAVMSLFVGVLQGYAQFVDMWWHGPEVIMTLLALCALLLGSGSVPRLAARGMVALFSAFLLLWKIIHMGEIFGRNASLYPARDAFADLLTLDALSAFGGTLGLLVLLAVLLPLVLPSPSRANTK